MQFISARCVRQNEPNRRAIAMKFVRPSVGLSGTGVHCGHMVHYRYADLTLWLNSAMFWAHRQQNLLPAVFLVPPGRDVVHHGCAK